MIFKYDCFRILGIFILILAPMFSNLFKTALRNIYKEKIYSLINILGLTLGITSSLFIILYVLDELSYDKYHENAANIYRIVSHIKEPDNEFTWAIAQIPLADELNEKYTEVIHAVRFIGTGRELFEHTEKDIRYYEEDFYYADPEVFDVFTYHFLEGDPSTALKEPNSIVLTRSVATKYFDDEESPLGKTLKSGENLFKVTGLIEDVPLNSHFRFDALMSRSTLPEEIGSWGNFGVFTYVLFPDAYDPNVFYSNLDTISKAHIAPIFESMGITINYQMQKIPDIHLHSRIGSEAESGGDISYVYIFTAVAVFMLIIACINYMNLATARASRRAKEVGIRKVVGSSKQLLIWQFMTESIVMAMLAVMVSLLLIIVLLPVFNLLSGKSIGFEHILQPMVLLGLAGIVVFVGIAGGSYPAFYLSGFNPVVVLKGKLSGSSGNAALRKSLVVLQFAISITMVISTWVVYDQLQYLRAKDLGFNQEQVVSIEMADQQIRDKYEVLRSELLNNPNIKSVSSANSKPGLDIGKLIMNVESNEGMVEKGVNLYAADYDFVETMQMTIVEGRNFSRDFATDTAAVLVNEAMVERMNWEEPIGKKIQRGGGENAPIFEVIGVVKDYHQQSLYDIIEPLTIFFGEKNYFLHIKILPQDVPNILQFIERTWNEIHPGKPLAYTFLDQDFFSQYQADQRRGQIFTTFSGLTILIACLGLLGLASYTTEQRTKEIGIRKVIGASVANVVMLLYKDFFILVAIAIVLAFPVAYYFMDRWLQTFAYQTDIKVLTFVLSALLTLLITLLAVGFHTIKAATANPVKALQSE